MITLASENLIRVVELLCSIVENNPIRAEMAHCHCHYRNKTLTLTTVSTGTQISAELPAEGQNEEAIFSLKANHLKEIVHSLQKSDQLELIPQLKVVQIKAGIGSFQLSTLSSDEIARFPFMKDQSNEPYFSLPVIEFQNMVEHVNYACAQDNKQLGKDALKGIYLEKTETEFSVVATDSVRLAWYKKSVESPYRTQNIIPKKLSQDLLKISDLGTFIELSLSPALFQARIGQIHIMSKVIDATFPDYRRIFDKKTNHATVVKRTELLEAAQAAAIVASGNPKHVKAIFSNGYLELLCENDADTSHIGVACSYQGESLELGMNVTYITDILSRSKKEEIEICFGSENHQVFISEKDNPDFQYVFMPSKF